MSVSDSISVPDSGRDELLSTRKIQELTRAAIALDDMSNPVSDPPMSRDHSETRRSVLASQKDAKDCVFRDVVTQRRSLET